MSLSGRDFTPTCPHIKISIRAPPKKIIHAHISGDDLFAGHQDGYLERLGELKGIIETGTGGEKIRKKKYR